MNYDIFISYTRRDNINNHVATLVDQISARFATFAGRPLRPFFDTREIEGGEYWQDKILTGLKESRLMLACLSPGYLESQWCEWEFIEYQKYELGRAFLGKGMAPIYFVTVPGFDQPDFEANCAKWVAELRRRQHYDLRPWHGEGEAALEQLDVAERLNAIIQQVWEQIRLGEQAEQRKGNLDRANDHFVGRTVETQRLHRLVGLGPVGTITVVNGLGGMGKTALALQYAHAYGHLFAGGCWQLRCEGKTDLKEAFASLRGQRDMDYELIEEEKKSLELQFERVLRELKKRADAVRLTGTEPLSQNQESAQGRVLVILDNVDQPELVADEQTRSLPQADWLYLLATTRLGIEDLDNFQENDFLSVDELSEEDGLALVESYQPNRSFLNADEREAALKIVRLLGGLPLAVEVAAVYMGAYRIPCQAFLARLQEDGHDYFHQAEQGKKGTIRHGEKCLALTLQPTLERLSPEERLALDYASLLPPDQIPLPWLRTLVAGEFPACGQDARPGDTDPWLEVVRRLLSFRLLQDTGVKDSQGFPLVVRMHRLVGEILCKNLREDLSSMLLLEIGELVRARARLLWEQWIKHHVRWEIRPLASLAQCWLKQKMTAGAYLANLLYQPMTGLAFFNECHHLLLEAMNIFKHYCATDRYSLAASYSNLGLVEMHLGNYSEARSCLLKAVDIFKHYCGTDHHSLATSYSNLAMVEKDLGNLTEAKSLLLKAVAINEQAHAPDHSALASRYSNLGLVEEALGNYTEAKSLLLKAVDIYRQCYEPNHPDLAKSYSNIAMVEKDLGNLTEAKRFLFKAVDIYEQAFPPNHPSLASSYSNLGLVEKDLGNLSEAKSLLLKAMAIQEEAYAMDHPSLANSYSNLAMVEMDMGNLSEARQLLLKAMAIEEQTYVSDHPTLATRYSNLALVEQDMGNLSEARHLLLKALVIEEQVYTSGHPNLAISYSNLALVEQDMGNLSEARHLLLKTVSINEQVYESGHPSLAISYSNLGLVEQRLSNCTEAKRLLLKAVAIFEQTYTSDHPILATCYVNLALVENDLGNLEEAATYQTKCITVLRYQVEQLGRNDLYLKLAHAETKQGELYQKLGRLAEAESSQRNHLAIIRHLVNEEGRTDLWNQMNIALSWLGSVLEEQGKLTEAAACHKERVIILQRLLAQQGEQFQESDLAASLRWQYAQSLYALANIETTLGLYPAAKRNVIDLLGLIRYPNFPNQKEIAASWLSCTISRLCDVLIESKELSEASGWVREYAELPIEPPEQAGYVNLHLLKLYQLQGRLAVEQQRYDEAVAWFRKGLERAYHAKAAGQVEAGTWADSFQYRLAQALHEARLPESKAAIEAAISCCRKWTKENTQDEATSFFARSLMLKARSLLESKQSAAALPLADEAQTLLRPLADKTWLPRKFLAECQQLLADIYETLDETETANHLREVAAATLQLPKEWEL